MFDKFENKSNLAKKKNFRERKIKPIFKKEKTDAKSNDKININEDD